MEKVRRFFKEYKFLVALVLLGILIYSNTFQSSFHFDDEIYILENYSIRNIWNLRGIWDFFPTRFVAFFTFALNYTFHRFHLFGYHLVNLIIHLGASILTWWFIRLIFETPAIKKHRLSEYKSSISLFAAFLFLSHPIQTQAVTYIWQRCTSLVAFFYLFSLCFYFKSRLLQGIKNAASRENTFYNLSLGSGVLALFTKENALTLPLIVLLCEFYFFKETRPIKWKKVIPFFCLWPIIPFVLLLTKSPRQFYSRSENRDQRP